MITNWRHTLARPSFLVAAAAAAVLHSPTAEAAKPAPSVRTPVVSRPSISVGEKRLALVKFEALSPAWSPDGKNVAFVERVGEGRTGHIWLASTSGSLRRLPNSGADGAPCWTPDGRLVVARIAKDRFTFHAVNTANGQARPLVSGRTFPLAGRDRVPSSVAFSPDGRKMAFDLCKPGETFDESGKIVLMDLKTSKVEDLKVPAKSVTSHPTWSPDGRYVAYQRLPKGWYFNRTGDESYQQIWLTDLRTSETRQVTTPEKEMNYLAPTWCPAGGILAVEKWLVSMKRESKRETWVVNPLNTESGALLPTVKRSVGGVEWAPDGKHYAFITALAVNGKFVNEIRTGVVSAQQRSAAVKLPATHTARSLNTVKPGAE